MLKKYFYLIVFCAGVGAGVGVGVAQEEKVQEFYDPLTPQSFVFDKDSHIFVGISSITNTIDLIDYSNNALNIKRSIKVDNVAGRHDVYAIYQPKGVAIYEGHIVYLATNRDSTLFVVLNLEGDMVKEFRFEGSAQAFSYSASAGELYIAGDNPVMGYDIMVLDVSDGFDNIRELPAKTHYRVPKKAELLFERDPSGWVLAVIAMSTVFMALILLYVIFKLLGNYMVRRQNKKAMKVAPHKIVHTEDLQKLPGSISGDVYAAIASAIYMYQNELHDEETTIITIDKVSRTYSPWSSKIYGLNTYFNK
ncbi:MAG: OadG family protein [Bacteroidales bacterium]|jgi:hypothetical protein|nr:OadG family protein [Bacteroidales bacterium]